jgi:hypothetical protein
MSRTFDIQSATLLKEKCNLSERTPERYWLEISNPHLGITLNLHCQRY